MRVIVTSAKSWDDQQSVVDAISKVPGGSTILIPTKYGACATVIDFAESLQFEIEDWSDDRVDYDRFGSATNADMIKSEDVDMCIAFVTKDSHVVKDCIRQARAYDLDLEIINR